MLAALPALSQRLNLGSGSTDRDLWRDFFAQGTLRLSSATPARWVSKASCRSGSARATVPADRRTGSSSRTRKRRLCGVRRKRIGEGRDEENPRCRCSCGSCGRAFDAAGRCAPQEAKAPRRAEAIRNTDANPVAGWPHHGADTHVLVRNAPIRWVGGALRSLLPLTRRLNAAGVAERLLWGQRLSGRRYVLNGHTRRRASAISRPERRPRRGAQSCRRPTTRPRPASLAET